LLLRVNAVAVVVSPITVSEGTVLAF